MSQQKQQGFTHAFLIIGLVVALIGALSFVFWQNFIHKEPVVTKTETQVISKKYNNLKNAETKPDYLVITDWGVKFPYNSESIEGQKLTYKVDASPETSRVEVNWADKGICNFGVSIARGGAPNPISYINYSPYDALAPGEYTFKSLYDKGLIGRVGDKFFAQAESGGYACEEGQGKRDKALDSKMTKAIVESIRNVVAIE